MTKTRQLRLKQLPGFSSSDREDEVPGSGAQSVGIGDEVQKWVAERVKTWPGANPSVTSRSLADGQGLARINSVKLLGGRGRPPAKFVPSATRYDWVRAYVLRKTPAEP